MKVFFKKYTEISAFLDERPSWAADWKWLTLLAVAVYFVTLAFRLQDVSNWSSPMLKAGGETIMATHDTYGWLAGAKGINAFATYGMSGMTRGLAQLTGAPLWKIGFWTPAFLGSLVAVVTAFWGWLLAGRRGGIAAGFLGALAPGFYFRSRLGYYATDLFTLLMPLLLGFMLAHLLSFCCTRGWLATGEERQEDKALPAALPWLALVYGLVARVAHFAHDDIQPTGVVLFWIALVLAAVTGRPGRRLDALKLLVIYGLAAYAGYRQRNLGVFHPEGLELIILAGTVVLVALLWRRPEKLGALLDHPWVWLAGLLVIAVLCNLLDPLRFFWAKALVYLKPVADLSLPGGSAAAGAADPGPIYPGITQSIREAKNVADWRTFFAGVAVAPWVGVLGGLGMTAILVLRPAFLLMLPFIVLGVSSLLLGVRFSMFGGPAFALGLGIGVHWLGRALIDRTGIAQRALSWVQVAVALVCLLGYQLIYADFRATPVLAPPHAEALMKLKNVAPKDAWVWTWWDFGYATQYYAERMTPTDGGKHVGRDIFATALAMSTPSYRQAAQVILLSAALDNEPARRWDKLPAREVRQDLATLAQADVPLKRAAPQYLVVCWENLSLLYWMTYYGSWDVVSGSGTHARRQDILEPFNVDQNRGVMVFKGPSAPIAIQSVDQLSSQGARRLSFAVNPAAPHLLINEVTHQVMLMDDLAYNSMAVQLLIGDPARPEQSRYFKLVHEGFPLVRIYEVLPPAQEPKGQAEAFTQ